MRIQKILVTGASGFIGSRLIPELLAQGYMVRAAARTLNNLKCRPWARHPNVELAQMDSLDMPSVCRACTGIDVVYYLIHSMDSRHKDFAEADQISASHTVTATEVQNVKRIIYLGGLGEEEDNLSRHLKSRAQVASILRSGNVPTTIFRAAMILGSGSVSYEIMAYLVRRLPLMVTPRWVRTESQPIAIRNVIYYLVECLKKNLSSGQSFDIGGPEILNYEELMRIYAEEMHLARRLIIPVPVLTPLLSSYWIDWVTPVPAALARPLAEGLKNRVICREESIKGILPQRLLDCRQAIRLALYSQYPAIEATHPGDPRWVYRQNKT